jgi:ATP-binding cassette, subfamily C, bacteriocin exporter
MKQSPARIKKAFTRQHDQSDCGVACLASLIKYFEGDVTLEKLRELSGTSRQGTTMLGLHQAASESGLLAEAFEGDIPNLKALDIPVILHVLIDNRLQHYVICYGYEHERFVISDPAGGISDYTEAELEKIWQSKALLTTQPNAHFIKAKKIKEEKWFWFKKLIRDDLNILGLALTLGFAVALLSLSTAIFSQKLIDDILPGKKLLKLEVGLALLFFLLIVKSFISWLRQHFLNKQSRNFNNRIISHFYGSLLHLPKLFFDNRKTGDLLARMNDTARIQNAVSYIGANLMIDALLIVVTSFFILSYSPSLGLIALLSIPLYFLSVFLFHRPIIDNQRKVMAAYSRNESNYVDTIQGVGVIKVSNKESFFSGSTRRVYDLFQETLFKLGGVKIRFNLVTEIVAALIVVTVISWGSIRVLHDALKLGEFMAIMQMVGILMPAAGRLALTNIQLQEAKVAFDRMFEYTSLRPEINAEDDRNKKQVEEFRKLEVKDLTFRFPGRKSLLTNISFTLNRGEMIALLGESGCGKSTTLQILQKFYRFESGSILVNGKAWDEISTISWRNTIGVVPQEIKIFNSTLIDNICLGNAEEKAEDVMRFCHEYGFQKFFMQFPQQYQTILGEEGVNLSGGQQQLVALARALYGKPQLLLLDEATSAMDRNTEAFVLKLLHDLRARMSIIMITHRVKTARHADCIYVMENGTVRAAGKHLDLLESENLYSDSWKELSL